MRNIKILINNIQVHIVYDSRSESPEHVGIPAVPVKVFSARTPVKETQGYTSDESNQDIRTSRASHRRQHKTKKEKIIWA